MKNLINLFFALLFFNGSYAQNTKIEVEVFLEGKSIVLKNGVNVAIISKTDTFLISSGNCFYLPDSLKGMTKNFLIQAGGFKFYFGQTLMTFNSQLPKWEIWLDNKPYLEENKWLVKEANKKSKCLYSLSNGTGTLYTVYSRKKLKPSF